MKVEEVIPEVMVPFNVIRESISIFFELIAIQSAYVAFRTHILDHIVLFISQRSKCIDDDTEYNIQENYSNNAEETHIIEESHPVSYFIRLKISKNVKYALEAYVFQRFSDSSSIPESILNDRQKASEN
jgi:hypothetical protein